ncbi:MAG: InlB B-repeat-containing protein, partial [Lachnospiraceae bacterium]|nr:InlB B-repeat-containing protein [Lachnospiraceae bacterium]
GDTPLLNEFDNLLTTSHMIKYGDRKKDKIMSDDESIVWSSDGNTKKQFGEYESNNKGEMALVETHTIATVGYVLLEEKTGETLPASITKNDAENDPKYSGLTLEMDYTLDQVKSILNDKYHVNYDAAGNIASVFEGKLLAYYKKVGEGEGVYSSNKYVRNAAGGAYSLNYMWVGTGAGANGDTDIEVTPWVGYNEYSTTNTVNSQGYAYHGSSAGFVNNAEDNNGKYASFKKAPAGYTGPSYNISGFSVNVTKKGSGGSSDQTNYYNKYYLMTEVSGGDYDISIPYTVTGYEGNAKELYEAKKVETTGKTVSPTVPFSASISLNGVTYTRYSEFTDWWGNDTYVTSKPDGYESATRFFYGKGASNRNYTLKYDDDYFYVCEDRSTDRYYKYRYEATKDKEKHYVISYDSNGSSHRESSNYCIVFFSPDENNRGNFIVDEDSLSATISGDRDYHMSYTETKKTIVPAKWEFVDKENGKYRNISKTDASGKTIVENEFHGIPQPTFHTQSEKTNGTLIEGLDIKVHLGEYDQVSCLDGGGLPVKGADKADKSEIYSKDYIRYVMVPVMGDVYTHTFEPYNSVAHDSDSIKVRSRYTWKGLSYYENSKIDTPEKEAEYAATEFSELLRSIEKLTNRQIPTNIKWFKDNQKYSSAYEKSYTSKDSFRKYSVGMAYPERKYSNGESVDTYKFIGWFKDRFGTNAFSGTDKVTSDMTLYAKWLTIYPSDVDDDAAWNGYSVRFSENITHSGGGDEEHADNMPGDITNLSNGAFVANPEDIPARVDYEFDGWTSGSGETLFKFADPAASDATNASSADKVTADVTLKAKWKALGADRYSIELNAGDIEGYQLVFSPEDITTVTDIAINGRRYYKKDKYDEEGNPVYVSEGVPAQEEIKYEAIKLPVPKCSKNGAESSDYEFAGWYFDAEFKYSAGHYTNDIQDIYQLDLAYLKAHRSANPSEEKTFVLYAKWIRTSERPKYTITLNPNKPSEATNDIEGLSGYSLGAGYGVVIDTGSKDEGGSLVAPVFAEEARPKLTLAGIGEDRKNYNVRVVTVTPTDLKNSA